MVSHSFLKPVKLLSLRLRCSYSNYPNAVKLAQQKYIPDKLAAANKYQSDSGPRGYVNRVWAWAFRTHSLP